MSIYRMSDVQPDLGQVDPSQPDYVKNRDILQEVRPIQINGEEVLDDKPDSGPLNLVAGRNVHIAAESGQVIISATGEGGEGGSGDEVVEGEGIDIELNALGQKVISLEPNSVTDEYIKSVSISKLVSDDKTILILKGGTANG